MLVLLNFIYDWWYFEKDLQKHSDIINLVRDLPQDADIVYVAESSNIHYRDDDLDKRHISEFVGDYFPGLNTYDITKPASHAGIYKILLEKIPLSYEIETVVVTLNLRSFNAQWIYSDLETPLQKSMVLLRDYPPLVNRFLLSFKAYDIKTEKEREKQVFRKWEKDEFHLPFEFPFNNVREWDKWMATWGIKDSNGRINYPKTELACHYIKTYGFQLDTVNNPRIKDFNEIIALARERGWNLAFNLLAENVEKADELVGDELVYMMNENARILNQYFTRRGVKVINNLHLVEDEQFVDQDWTTEHYAEKGRKAIAESVARAIGEWHKEYYREVVSKNNYQTIFYNDFEDESRWGNSNSINEDMAYSGSRSSATGKGIDYSAGLSYPLKIIPDSLKNTVTIEFMVYQTGSDHDTKVVMEAFGEFDHHWQGADIKSETKEIDQWKFYRKRFAIPDSIKNADLIKVYVYNPSQVMVYVDDFRISIN
jgi:hypothetical protein